MGSAADSKIALRRVPSRLAGIRFAVQADVGANFVDHEFDQAILRALLLRMR
jgi:hypothetical protein